MSGDDGGQTKKPAFDLEERTARFGEGVIHFAKTGRRILSPLHLSANLFGRVRVWGQIIAKRMTPIQKKISKTKLALAAKKRGKLSFDCA
jgi:hypothetical protein